MLNALVLVGRVGQEPELKHFESGRVMATFRMAVDRPKKAEQDPITDWFTVEVWGRQAEVAHQFLRKGNWVGIEGRLAFKRWIDDQDQAQEVPFVQANHLKLLGGRPHEDEELVF